MNEIYEPSKNLSLDESVVLWRGRLIFRHTIKIKGISTASKCIC